MRHFLAPLVVLLLSATSHAGSLVPPLRVDDALWRDAARAALGSALVASRDVEELFDGNTKAQREADSAPPRAYYGGGGTGPGAIAPQNRTFGLGVMFGGPTALTGKYTLTRDQALQFGLGLGFGGNYFNNTFVFTSIDTFALYLDYLWSLLRFVDVEPMSLNFYIGGGGLASVRYFGPFYGVPLVAARMPLGITMLFKPIPLEVFLEVAPTLSVLPGIGLGIGGGLGVRWYF